MSGAHSHAIEIATDRWPSANSRVTRGQRDGPAGVAKRAAQTTAGVLSYFPLTLSPSSTRRRIAQRRHIGLLLGPPDCLFSNYPQHGARASSPKGSNRPSMRKNPMPVEGNGFILTLVQLCKTLARTSSSREAAKRGFEQRTFERQANAHWQAPCINPWRIHAATVERSRQSRTSGRPNSGNLQIHS